jgi:hypothetical protein
MNLLDRKSLYPRTRLKRPASRRPALEPLERRHLLSVSLPGIEATQPADGAVLLQTPQQLAITFAPCDVKQIDEDYSGLFGTAPDQTFPTLVAFDSATDGNDEFVLDQVGAGGVATPVLGVGTQSFVQENVTIQTDADGTVTQAQVVVSPEAGNLALGPGTYQIAILPGTALATAFSMLYASSAWAGSQPVPIAQFTVLGQGVTLGNAVKLGNISPTTQTVSGFIDPQDSSSAVSLYQITLPPGHLWQLNAQVLAQASGSPLLAGLTLFDAQGNELAQNKAGEGSANDQSDPSLIKGLEPGTYYVGISDDNNLPGRLNGYNPVTGTPGTAGFDDPSGPFRLQLFAEPVVGTTTLVSESLDHADSFEPSPTGLDLTFSGSVDATPLFLPDQQETALEVVDSSGRVWPITAVSDQTSTNTLGFIFDEPLPAGSYSLVEPAQGGLTDLSGQPLVAPAGNPPGVLARWTVAAATGPSDPDNLGVIWPGPVNVTWDSSIARTTELAAGQETAYRFVVICPGIYEVQTRVSTGQVDLEVTGAGGTTVLTADNLIGLNRSYPTLQPGVYSVRLIAAGAQPALVQWVLKPIALDYEKIIENGVGQTPVLTSSLVGSLPDDQAASASDGAANGVTSGGIGAGSTVTTLVASPIPSSLLLVSMDAGLMGLPGANTENVAAVGPMVEGAMVSVADRVNGLMPGIRYGSGSNSESSVGNGDTPEDTGSANGQPADPQEAASLAVAAKPETASARDDARVLAQVDRLLGLVDWFQGDITPSWLDGMFNATSTPRVPNSPEILAQPDLPAHSRRRNRREHLLEADLTIPLCVIVASAAAYRLQHPLLKRLDRKAHAFNGPRRPHLFSGRRPHSPTFHVGTTYHARLPRRPS